MFKFLKKETKIFDDNLKRILVIRIDAIGDYILFRNYLKLIKDHYGECEITLIGNPQWQELAEHFDSEIVKKFIWLDKQRYQKDAHYIRKFDKNIKKQKFDILISPVYSREAWVLEPLAARANVKEKIGFWGDLTNITGSDRIYNAQKYSKIVDSDPDLKFEFLRNKEFFEKLFNHEINIKKPYFELKEERKYEFSDQKYAVIFPGAGIGFREWNVENYAQVTEFIIKNYGLNIVLVGSQSDITRANQIKSIANNEKVINYVGKTKLYELPFIFKDAEFVLSGDTCAYHFSVAVGTKTFCLSNGNTLIRFVPYPEEIFDDVHFIFPAEIEENLNQLEKIAEKYIYASILDINKISAKQIIDLIKDNYNK